MPKVHTTLLIDDNLRAIAKQAGINLSESLDEILRKKLNIERTDTDLELRRIEYEKAKYKKELDKLERVQEALQKKQIATEAEEKTKTDAEAKKPEVLVAEKEKAIAREIKTVWPELVRRRELSTPIKREKTFKSRVNTLSHLGITLDEYRKRVVEVCERRGGVL